MPATINFSQRFKKIKTPERLTEIAEKAKSNLLRTLEEESQWLGEVADLNETDLQNFIAGTKKQLDETIEKSRSPVRVSLIGPFSSGKTVTLCALLGQPNLLPRAAQPTSGNVVEVQIVPPGTSDKLNVINCTLFSPLELEDMLRDYYLFLRSKRLDLKALPDTKGFLREQVNRLCQDVKEQLTEKRREYKKRTAGMGHVSFEVLTNLAHLYFILVTIRRYFDSYPNLTNPESLVLSIPYSPTDKSAQDRLVAVTMLDMQWGIDDFEPDLLADKVNKFWQHLPTSPADLKKHCEQGTIRTEALRALLPLYKRILLTQEMTLNDAGWGDIRRISFLDFPGVGSDNRRDTYLCLKELPLAHVNMLFFLANRPAAKEAQQLLEVIAEAKQHLTRLSDRIIPVVNFFDGYDRLPEAVSEEDGRADTVAKEQQALQRVQNFFSTERVSGVEEGFDVFDKSILGGLFPDGKAWDYYLLSPIASLNPQSLTEKEKGYIEAYNKQKDRYGQLLRDLKVAEKILKKDRTPTSNEALKKYNRLLDALESYQQDGGIKRLREDLINLLKKDGFRLIVEDAAPALQTVLEQVEVDIIDKLAEVDIDEQDAEEFVGDKKTREAVVTLWEQMEKLTAKWLPNAEWVVLQHQDPLTKGSREIKYISPLTLCETEVLKKVLSDGFWQEWANRWLVPPVGTQPTKLSELKTQYQKWEAELIAWGRTAIVVMIQQTLAKLDQHPLTLDLGTSEQTVSFTELREALFNDYVSKANEVVAAEENILKELFSLTSLQQELRSAMEDLKDSSAPSQEANTKVPFNEDLQFNWAPVELMKIQRQVILTLQRRIASDFAFYMSVFFQEFGRLLDQRTRQKNTSQRQQFEQPGGLFDKLARIRQSTGELVQKDSLTRRERRQKAREGVAKIRNAWEELQKLF